MHPPIACLAARRPRAPPRRSAPPWRGRAGAASVDRAPPSSPTPTIRARRPSRPVAEPTADPSPIADPPSAPTASRRRTSDPPAPTPGSGRSRRHAAQPTADPAASRPDRPLHRRPEARHGRRRHRREATGAKQASRPTGRFDTRHPRLSAPSSSEARAPRSAPTRPCAMIVPDEMIQLTQTTPTGVSRIGGRLNADRRRSTGSTSGSTPTSRSSTRGSPRSPTSTSPAATTAPPRDRTAWRDEERPRHARRRHGRRARQRHRRRRRRARAPGCGRVKILNDDGYGLLSWYVCGLDWILAQRDPNDPTRPLFEAVNMSVTKAGSRRRATAGSTNNDILHQAICRARRGRR